MTWRAKLLGDAVGVGHAHEVNGVLPLGGSVGWSHVVRLSLASCFTPHTHLVHSLKNCLSQISSSAQTPKMLFLIVFMSIIGAMKAAALFAVRRVSLK
jgi:hypothetical protein